MTKIRLILSIGAIVAGVMLALSATIAATPSTALAGETAWSCLPPSTSTATPTQEQISIIQPSGASDVGMAQQDPTATPTCTPTGHVKTATPTPTNTPEETDTPVPPTESPATNTPVPPTATPPGGGVGGQGVSPPNTGSGPEAGTVNWSMVVVAGALLLGGAGSLAGSVRRRR